MSALVGRPNVGKSALFNRICQKRMAIVDEMEGVTRDRLYGKAELFGRSFELIDTGGIDLSASLPFAEEVKVQAEIAIREADSLILVVDGRVGVTSLDRSVAQLLLRACKPLILAVNKIDNEDESLLAPFYSLGIKEVVAVSATQGRQVAELCSAALAPCPLLEGEEKGGGIRVALIGRPNVGKSTLLNQLLDEERCVVSPTAGTTRDAIDATLEYQGKEFTFIDTAGIRRKKAEHEVVDKFAAIRTARAIERAEICILMVEAEEGLTTQEKRILSQVEAAGKGCILFFNKWDRVKGFRMEHCKESLRQEASFTAYLPTLFGSAKEGKGVEALFPQIEKVHAQLSQRLTTGQLNKFVSEAMARVHPPMIRGKRLRIYYLTQVESAPPRFIFFVNHPSLLSESYKKYLINQFRRMYGFDGAPLFFHLKGKKGGSGLENSLTH